MTIQDFKPLLDWVSAHPHLAGWIVLLISFTEAMAIVGLIMPGSIIMTAIGTMVGSKILPAPEILAFSATGTILANLLSYWLGYHYHDRIRGIWPFRSFPELFNKGQAFFARHGGKSVFLGQFAGPLRAIMPLTAGIMNMPPARFILIAVISGTLWPPIFMTPGLLIGALSRQLPPEAATRFILLLAVLLLAIWALFWLSKKFLGYCYRLWQQAVQRLWLWLRQQPSCANIVQSLENQAMPEASSQLALAWWFIFCTVLGIGLAYNVYHHGSLTALNESYWYFFTHLRLDSIYNFFLGVTLLGDTKLIVVLLTCLLIFFLVTKAWRTAFYWASCGLFALLSTQFIKYLVFSPRPTGLLHPPENGSFPSGHTSLSIAIFGFLAVIIAEHLPMQYRRFCYWAAGLLCVLIAFSRLYLGVHWLTDIVGGALLGLGTLAIFTLLYRRQLTGNPLPYWKLLGTALSAIALAWAALFIKDYSVLQQNYRLVHHNIIHLISARDWWQHGQKENLVRTNQFGHAAQHFNIQWAGDLTNIKQLLLNQGFKEAPKLNLETAVTELTGKGSSKEPTGPLVPVVYAGHKPSLVLLKFYNDDNTLLILRLWRTNTLLFQPTSPLWVGTINYHYTWKPRLLTRKKLTYPTTSAITKFSKELRSVQWRTLAYPNQPNFNQQADRDWEQKILLIH